MLTQLNAEVPPFVEKTSQQKVLIINNVLHLHNYVSFYAYAHALLKMGQKVARVLTITGLEVDAFLVFFLVVCGVPGTFSVCALDITLTGWQKRPMRRLHLMSHTITLPSLAPVAKMTDKETDLIQFVYWYRENVLWVLLRPICSIIMQKTITKTHLS